MFSKNVNYVIINLEQHNTTNYIIYNTYLTKLILSSKNIVSFANKIK